MATDLHSGSIKHLTPKASRRTHLLAAALLWSLVGIGLATAGCIWVARNGSRLTPIVLVAAAVAGVVKARYVLFRAARRIADRIESRGNGRCIGGFFSWKTWMLALSMALFGRLLRASPLPFTARGALYFAIGIALLLASLRIWDRWRRAARESQV